MEFNSKKLFLILIGYVIWVSFIYLSVAFIKADLNAFNWSSEARSVIPVFSVIYLIFAPIMAITNK